MPYTMIDFFAGIGGFTLGFEAAGFDCIGHCEIDRYAQRSYRAIHGIKEGAWFADDITTVRPEDVPPCDLITAGFPCQDISCASGRGSGLRGARSSLFFEIIRIVQGKQRSDRPRWIVLENVKNLLSINRGWDFATILHSLAESGYDVEYQLLNSKHFGVPQNRERVFLVGHLRGRGSGKVFPVIGTDGKNIIRLIAGRQGSRVYDPAGIGITLTAQGGGKGGQTGLYAVSYNRKEGITGALDTAHALNASDYRGINRNQQQNAVLVDQAIHPPALTDTVRDVRAHYNTSVIRVGNTNPSGSGMNGNVYSTEGLSPALTTNKGEGMKVAIPGSQTRRGRVGKGVANTLDTSCSQGVLHGCRIRKLTPRECWRLQAVPDELFDRAAAVNSDTQLYKQAGNGVTVSVIYAIARKIAESEVQG